MADNTTLNSGAGGDTVATDDIGGVKHQRVKIQYGDDGSATDVSDVNPLPIDDAGGSLTVDGTVTADAGTGPWPVTDNGGALSVDDGGGSLTVDNAVLSVTGGGVESSALRVTLASDSTGVVSVDDGGATLSVDDGAGSLTVDATQLDVDDLAPTADGVSAALDTSQMMAGLTALTPKFAVIDVIGSGDNTIVAAVASKKLRVLSAFLVSAGTVTTRFESGAGTTALTGQMNLVANSGFVLPFNPVGWFETTAGELLNLELSAAVSVDGSLVYVEV